MEASIPHDEAARLQALREYAVLDTPSETDFDDLVSLAAKICHTPISLVSLVDKDRQWFKGRYGLEIHETPRRLSFCAHTILQAPEPLVVPDASKDSRFKDNELVTGASGFLAYAGAPLVTPEGYALGTLCVIDTQARNFTPDQLEALRILSRQVLTQLELRRKINTLHCLSQELGRAQASEQRRLESLVQARTAELDSLNHELRRSEERLRILAQATFEGILFSEHGKIIDCNDQLAQIVGLTRQDLIGRHVLEFIKPEEHELAMQGVRQNRDSALELHLKHKDNGWRIVEVRGRPLAGTPRLRVASIRDLTDQKLAQHELQLHRERLDGIVSAAMDAIISVNEQHRIVLFNPAAESLFGVPAREACGQHINRFIPEPFHAVQIQPSPTGLTNRRIGSLGTLSGLRSNGQPFPIEASISQSEVHGEKLFTVILRDITERKRAEDQARLWERLFEAADFGLAYTDATTDRFLAVNPSFARQRGYEPQELIGKGMHYVVPREIVETLPARLSEINRSGHLVYESVHLRKDGSRFPVLIEATVIRDTQGRPVSRVSYALDITELVAAREILSHSNQELERQVQERTAELVEANANLQSFTYTAAHDLRAPLRAIISLSQILLHQAGSALNPTSRSLLERVAQSANQMAALLNDLLEFSKMNQSTLCLEPVSLQRTVDEALAMMSQDIASTNADITLNQSLPQVVGHPATIVLIVSNLISNALKFVPKGTRPSVRIWSDILESSVRLHVQDNGIGIRSADLDRVFGAFQRVHSKDAYAGTGLGLAIVKRAAARMGGRVGVVSEEGKGSTFWVELAKPRSQ
ncbi:MAG TPA: PAS domain S-box protein [Clostridia bacterium]|nr:PAS domain S-box protein [Clostridia bacterium]